MMSASEITLGYIFLDNSYSFMSGGKTSPLLSDKGIFWSDKEFCIPIDPGIISKTYHYILYLKL